MADELMTTYDLDELLRYPNGRSARLARKGQIPHVILPDGEIRFRPEAIRNWLNERETGVSTAAAAET